MFSFVIEIIIAIVLLVALIEESLLLLLYKPYRPVKEQDTPFVSILVAMRDEENNADRCLEHLRKQD